MIHEIEDSVNLTPPPNSDNEDGADESEIMCTKGALKNPLKVEKMQLQIIDFAATVEGTIFLMSDGEYQTWKITCDDLLIEDLKQLKVMKSVIEVKKEEF